MWIFQLLLAWALLFWAFRLLFGVGGKHKSDRPSDETGHEDELASRSESGYFQDSPDALRPDVDPDDHFDPTDYF